MFFRKNQTRLRVAPATHTNDERSVRAGEVRPPAKSNLGKGKRTHIYEVGELIYWSPGPDVAIFYRHDGQAIPNPGIIVIGKIDSGVEALNIRGSVNVTMELIEQ